MTDAVDATDSGRPGAGACVVEQRSSRLGRADILVVNRRAAAHAARKYLAGRFTDISIDAPHMSGKSVT